MSVVQFSKCCRKFWGASAQGCTEATRIVNHRIACCSSGSASDYQYNTDKDPNQHVWGEMQMQLSTDIFGPNWHSELIHCYCMFDASLLIWDERSDDDVLPELRPDHAPMIHTAALLLPSLQAPLVQQIHDMCTKTAISVQIKIDELLAGNKD